MDPQLRQEVRFITTRLGAIIREQAGARAFRQIEDVRRLSKAVRAHHDRASIRAKRRAIAALTLSEAHQVAHAFSLFFQLANLCEERARARHLQATPSPPQSLRRLFASLKEAGIPAATVQRCLDSLEINPVLTAHPTEARRRTVLNHILRIANDFEHPDEALEALWQTDEIRERRVGPLDEVENTLFFFERTILPAAANFYRKFDAELAAAYPELRRRHAFLTFGSWVGGDRDGHPYVTAEVSLGTASRHRSLMVRHFKEQCDLLISELTHAAPGRPPPGGEPFQPHEVHRRRLLDLRRGLERLRSAEPLVRELESIRRGLRRQRAHRAAAGRIATAIDQARTFGLHLAQIDFRDHSGKIAGAPAELEDQFRTLAAIQREHGEEAAHHYILSMTRSAADLAALLDLARRAGAKADIVPLFETIEDLDHAPAVMDAAWSDPAYRRHLRRRGGIQEIMLGYSDSNKDGGYLAANWLLHGAQDRLAALADRRGIKVRFFHGKGGSIDRGGGMSHRSLRAQPHAAHGGRIRITEQGEVVSLKYSNPVVAVRNLEQLASAVIAANCLPEPPMKPGWSDTMDQLARASLQGYQDLVRRAPEFVAYYRQATPIDLIEHLRIGSRPSRRSGDGDVSQLRAIPWVFSWTQSRHLLSAWYGMGSAFQGHGDLEALRAMYREWPFFATLIDNAELSLAKTDLYIAGRYASLVRDASVRKRVFDRIASEYERTVHMVLAIAQRHRLLANQPVLAESIRLRNPYVDPLHYLQIRFLPRWRRNPDNESLRRLLALTVNGIAFGMKSTG